MKSAFSIRESLAFGWDKTVRHSGIVFGALLTLFALEVAQALVRDVLSGQFIGALAAVALMVSQCIAGIGFIYITLRIAKAERVKFSDIVPSTPLVWNYLLASLLSGVLVLIGLLFLIIPGVYLLLRFSMVRFAVLEGAGAWDSLNKSSALTKGVRLKLLGFLIICGLLNVAGALFFVVGLLMSVPVTMIAYAHVYKKLQARHAHAQ